jgi:hypothetical protein
MSYDRKATIRTQAKWQAEQEYTHFGTAMFKYGHNLTDVEVVKALNRLFNGIDREIYSSKDVNNGMRVQRMVYLERGRSRNNLHSHFFYKAESSEQANDIEKIAEEIWLNKINKSHSLVILPNTQHDNRNSYAMKEHYFADDDIHQPHLTVIWK